MPKPNITQVKPNGAPKKLNDSDKLKVLEKQNQLLATQNQLMQAGQKAAALQNEFNTLVASLEKQYGGKISL